MITPQGDFRLLPQDLLIYILKDFQLRDMNSVARISKLFRDIVKSIWENRARALGITCWDKTVGIQQEISICSKLEDQFAFVNMVLGPMAPSAVKKIPEIHFVHTRKIVPDWLKCYPQASIVRGTKYETHMHRYINMVAFFVQDHPRRERTIIMVRELPKHFTEWQKQYLQRLVQNLPCGSLQYEWDGIAIAEGHPLAIRREYNDKWVCTKRYQASAVELSLPSDNEEKSHQLNPAIPGRFVYF